MAGGKSGGAGTQHDRHTHVLPLVQRAAEGRVQLVLGLVNCARRRGSRGGSWGDRVSIARRGNGGESGRANANVLRRVKSERWRKVAARTRGGSWYGAPHLAVFLEVNYGNLNFKFPWNGNACST